MNRENHVAGFVANAGIGVGCNIIEKLLARFSNGGGAVDLACSNGAEGSE